MTVASFTLVMVALAWLATRGAPVDALLYVVPPVATWISLWVLAGFLPGSRWGPVAVATMAYLVGGAIAATAFYGTGYSGSATGPGVAAHLVVWPTLVLLCVGCGAGFAPCPN